MSDEGEKTCPLCAEEMDLTDQQLKPCKCGYEICVWCWHHIMDMAEKDNTEGRCPACRTPYNKEKIVGTATNCERLVVEMNMERKVKSQKAKSKTSEGRKNLSSVRVIQRNLAYIVGLPLNLADEDLLQRREYFGQYGKVLKVSISRTAAGSIQQFANNTCSVYITYSKEEEAVRCIQSVHGFVLDGSSLRACFGTTKYCHAWLRNMPCSNPDCLYLHENGSQEDSFTKDEVISAYTRSRVQQITGATNNMQRRTGYVLPPPADDYYINGSASSEKPISASNNTTSSVRSSPPNSSSGRSVPLPASTSWGTRASSCQPPPANLICSNGPSKQKPETCSGSVAFSTAVAGTTQVPLLQDDVRKKLIPGEEGRTILHKGKLEPQEPGRHRVGTEHRTTASEVPASLGLPVTSTANGQFYCPPGSEDKERSTGAAPNITNSFDLPKGSYGHGSDKDLNVSIGGNIENPLSVMASLSIDKRHGSEHSRDTRPNSSLSENTLVNTPRLSDSVAREDSEMKSDSCTQVALTNSQVAIPEAEEDLRDFEDQRLKDPEVVTRTSYFVNSSPSFHLSNQSSIYSPQQNGLHVSTSVGIDPQILNEVVDKATLLHPSGVPRVRNGYPVNKISSMDSECTVGNSYLLPIEVKKQQVARFGGAAVNTVQNAATESGESSIISNILSMDFDAWDESLTSPQNFSKLLGENDRRQGSLQKSSSWKVQNSSQSRFSFARQEESRYQVSDIQPSVSTFGQVLKDRPFSHDFSEDRDFSYDKFGDYNGFSAFNSEESSSFAGSHSHIYSNNLSVSRAQISAPPGFSVPNRAPPPGFTSHERMEPAFDAMSGNHLLDPLFLMRNPYQTPTTGNIGDIEFMDPAILAVGKGRLPNGLHNAPSLEMRPNFPSQLSAFENEARVQLMMQRTLPLQNQRFADMGDGFSSLSDGYRIPSRVMDQTTLTNNISPFSHHSLQQSRTPPMSNGQWDGWNEIQSGNMAELLRSEKLGLNQLYSGYEDSKYRMPSSGDLYNRPYGI